MKHYWTWLPRVLGNRTDAPHEHARNVPLIKSDLLSFVLLCSCICIQFVYISLILRLSWSGTTSRFLFTCGINLVTMDEKRNSKSSSILSSDSTPLQALQKRLTTWDLNLESEYSSVYNLDKDDESIIKNPVASVVEKEEEDSPYAEVRAAVPNYDEEMPANTIRAWVLGLTLAFVGAAVNTLFSLRNPVIGIGVIVAQVASP